MLTFYRNVDLSAFSTSSEKLFVEYSENGKTIGTLKVLTHMSPSHYLYLEEDGRVARRSAGIPFITDDLLSLDLLYELVIKQAAQ